MNMNIMAILQNELTGHRETHSLSASLSQAVDTIEQLFTSGFTDIVIRRDISSSHLLDDVDTFVYSAKPLSPNPSPYKIEAVIEKDAFRKTVHCVLPADSGARDIGLFQIYERDRANDFETTCSR